MDKRGLTVPVIPPKDNTKIVFQMTGAVTSIDGGQRGHMLPKSSPQVKMYFTVDTPNGPDKVFQCQAFQLMDCQEYTLVHY